VEGSEEEVVERGEVMKLKNDKVQERKKGGALEKRSE